MMHKLFENFFEFFEFSSFHKVSDKSTIIWWHHRKLFVNFLKFFEFHQVSKKFPQIIKIHFLQIHVFLIDRKLFQILLPIKKFTSIIKSWFCCSVKLFRIYVLPKLFEIPAAINFFEFYGNRNFLTQDQEMTLLAKTNDNPTISEITIFGLAHTFP